MQLDYFNKRESFITSPEFGSGLLAGIVVGLAAGILLAPRSGKETRRKITGSVQNQAEELEDLWDDTQSQVDQQLHRAKQSAKDMEDKLEDVADETRSRGKKLYHEAADDVEEAKEDAKSVIDKAKEFFKNN